YGRARPRADLRRRDTEALAPALPLAGRDAPRPLDVTERGLTFLVELGAGLSTGLFTDQRDGRSRVRAAANGARLLNLFCYTGSFTVAAAAGGAAETVSVDLSASALRGLNRNLAANGLSGPRHRVLREDALRYLPRARRRGERFDLVVLDPPSFGTRGQGTFSVERDHARLLEDALAVTAPGGALLAVTHHRGVTAEGLAVRVRSLGAAAGHEGLTAEPLRPPPDHPDVEHGARSVWARVVG
ncbi:MAG: class I SAM-dependent rRNA methyltransferase, partial [Deltaproteobacteria bacterium]|nr:class I SAM-dependent rRNA methyltransferase [Deltaproteobacteria bacterium]